MRTLVKFLLILAATNWCFAGELSDESLLQVRIVDFKVAGSGEGHTQFWVLNAIVERTIAGDYSGDKIKFVWATHLENPRLIRPIQYVLVATYSDDDFPARFGTKWMAIETAIPISIVCFRTDLREMFPDAKLPEKTDIHPDDKECYKEELYVVPE